MRFGIVQFTSDTGPSPVRVAAAAERAGFDSFWVPEHTHIPVARQAAHPGTGTSELPDERYLRTLDPWVVLSMIAAVTRRIRLSTAVALPVEHDAIALAKTIATLDHLTGGRVTLGAGFGWNTDELAHHGVQPRHRRTALREHLEAMQALWSQQEASYRGEHISFGPSWAFPKPAQQPRVPVLIGAGGTGKTFAWIARWADGWITTPTEGELDDKIALLRKTWREAGREGEPQIVALAGKPDPQVLARWAELGVTEVVFGVQHKPADEVEPFLARLAGKLGIQEG
ncbi:LLM class F420-dependent oxidoreductase [Saccharopolyspora griseoalba]|uniref:LLM class F420-dependent oxidoreductase n=1 Tax=Saccharopolyspora griseoalba TaxID=1431848 RepID=A0ABW2LLH0_9PSEU